MLILLQNCCKEKYIPVVTFMSAADSNAATCDCQIEGSNLICLSQSAKASYQPQLNSEIKNRIAQCGDKHSLLKAIETEPSTMEVLCVGLLTSSTFCHFNVEMVDTLVTEIGVSRNITGNSVSVQTHNLKDRWILSLLLSSLFIKGQSEPMFRPCPRRIY